MAGSGLKRWHGDLANERASEPTRTERADEAGRERACEGVRGAQALGVMKCLVEQGEFISWVSVVSA